MKECINDKSFLPKIVFVGFIATWFLAESPINLSLSVKATYEGVTLLPWSLAMISTFPCWNTPTQEYVVPKSMPISVIRSKLCICINFSSYSIWQGYINCLTMLVWYPFNVKFYGYEKFSIFNGRIIANHDVSQFHADKKTFISLVCFHFLQCRCFYGW